MKIAWSPLAIDRVSEIVKYISENDINIATNLVDRIFNRVKQLEMFPKSGCVLERLTVSATTEIISF